VVGNYFVYSKMSVASWL